MNSPFFFRKSYLSTSLDINTNDGNQKTLHTNFKKVKKIFTEFFLDPLQTPYIRQNPAYFAPHISSKYEETDPHS